MRHLASILVVLVLSGCASYYQRNIEFQSQVAHGNLEKAESLLLGNKRMQKDRNRLLFLLNMGFVNHMQQEFAESNKYFNEADLLIEDYKRNYASEALALVSNQEVRPYRAEDFETVMVHYYKALNYLHLGDYDGTLVEARRMNLLLNRMNDKYKDHKNRYQADAFAHILMGLAYEASGDLGNAFIAYRNAYDVYTGEHGYFDIAPPKQLEDDLLRLTDALGYYNEYDFFKRTFGREYSSKPASGGGELVFLWHNGMGPIKDEWSINFFAVPGAGGYVIFENEEIGLTFPFYVGDDDQQRADLLALKVVRVAFPKYLERPNYFKGGNLELNDQVYPLYLAENINAIAFKTLEDRFLRQMGASLLRLGIKKVAEYKLSQENEALGALAKITNAATEKADTRNWQTLPHSIYYARIPLNKGQNEVVLNTSSGKGAAGNTLFTFEGRAGRMQFQRYHSLEHLPAAPWDYATSVFMD